MNDNHHLLGLSNAMSRSPGRYAPIPSAALSNTSVIPRATLSLAITALILLGCVQLATAQPPTWGQCSCPVTDNPEAENAKYSTITNASLCVNAESRTPICRIEVRCLQDGTGPNCGSLAQSNWTLMELRSALDSITKSTFESKPDLVYALGAVYNSTLSGTVWPDISDCLAGFTHQDSIEPVDRRFDSWRNEQEGISCIYTTSGWLHIVISPSSGNLIYDPIIRVSYQFAPPKR